MVKTVEGLPKIVIPPAPAKLPETPGVYLFWHKKTVIYVGKSVNLKNRIASYFASDLESKTAAMVKEADSLSLIQVTSDLESLLLEAKLIRGLMRCLIVSCKALF